MAINDHPDVRCNNQRHPKPYRPVAVAIVILIGDRGGYGCCATCLQELIDDPAPVPWPVVYLDPARVRGTVTHSNAATPAVHRTFTDLPPDLIS